MKVLIVYPILTKQINPPNTERTYKNKTRTYDTLVNIEMLVKLQKIHKPAILLIVIMIDCLQTYIIINQKLTMNRFKSGPF
jgi:hypothetical protein